MTKSEAVAFISGELDENYLEQALARADREFMGGPVELEQLHGGRTGAQVHKIRAGGESYVVKRAPIDSWIPKAMNSRGEGPIWQGGWLSDLPGPLGCPIIDAAYHKPNEAWWLLMTDVSDGIRPRGAFGENETLTLWRAMARLHAKYWGQADVLRDMPIVDTAQTTRIFAEPVSCAAGQPTHEKWVQRIAEEFMPLRFLLPKFLELIEPADAEFYIEMTKNRDWHQDLDVATPTFLHGDLRRANIAFQKDDVVLFDWELASRGPAACDLQWNSFLTFWAYPPGDGRKPWERNHLRDAYLQELEAHLGFRVDRDEFLRTWDLGLVRMISTLGFCFADIDFDDPAERADAAERAKVGLQMCREALDR